MGVMQLAGYVSLDNPDVTVMGPFRRTNDPGDLQVIIDLPNGYGVSLITLRDQRYADGTVEMLAGYVTDTPDGPCFTEAQTGEFSFCPDVVREVEGQNRHRIDAVLTELRALPAHGRRDKAADAWTAEQ